MTAPTRVVDLDEIPLDCTDDDIITLRMLCDLRHEPHRRWKISPNARGAWDYEKA